MSRVLIVGAGFAGAVVAERLASAGLRVRLVDRRSHLGGNAYDEPDDHGVLVHRFGPHFFHTNSQRIFDYLSRFTAWHGYEHRVLSSVDGRLYPFPINLDTLNQLYGLQLDEAGARRFLDEVREPCASIKTSEDVVLNAVGRHLYETFFRGYTRKHWGLNPSELAGSVAARIPVRTNHDDRYFTDSYQGMPLEGYTRLFERLVDHPLIDVELGVDYHALRSHVQALHTVYTGPIDAFFDYRFGRLPYRSLRFEHEHLPGVSRYQAVAQINYPNEHAYTRVVEIKHATGQQHAGTSIVREYPSAEGDPYYPIPRPENEALYRQYAALAEREPDVTFVGRLAQYKYYNMDQVVAAALLAAERICAVLAPIG